MMPQTREEIETHERRHLAPYAALSSESRGRVYAQEEHDLRTAFQRDRDRVIHSAAFRRLEYKTQVFIPHEKDHFRTRLTHTIEVAQIARTLARNLQVNEDLAEAVALVHDLGHTPFGHAGEDVLNSLLADLGGFNHNRQSLRVVDKLEQRYPEHPGLNLSREVREGIVKHETTTSIVPPEFDNGLQPTLEASLVDIADEIAYNSHDVDDGISAGIIEWDELSREGFFRSLVGPYSVALTRLEGDLRRYALVRHLVDVMATDVIEETARRIKEGGITDLDSIHRSPRKLCGYSDRMQEQVIALKGFLRDHLYRHPHLVTLSRRAADILTSVFERIQKDPSLMPPRFRQMLESERTETVTADYIAGMTDRYAEKVHGELAG